MAVDADAEEEADDRKRVGPTPRAVFDLGDQFGDGGAQGFRQAFRQAGTQEREGIGNGDLLEGGFGKGILSGSAEVIGDEDEERGPKMVIGEGITQFDELAAGDKERVAVVNLAGEDVNATPEYEDCAKLAREKGVPLKAVLAAAVAAAAKLR